jgi:hypothetical protein
MLCVLNLHLQAKRHRCYQYVTTSSEVGSSPCSGCVQAVDVTSLLAIADPFFIFHLFCLVFPNTWFSFPHCVLCI